MPIQSPTGDGGGDGFETIHDAFIAAADKMGDAPALVRGGKEGVGTAPVISFSSLLRLCRVFASHLESHHERDNTWGTTRRRTTRPPRIDEQGALVVGATAAVMLDSSDELMVAYFACLMAGYSFAPVETSLPPSSIEGLLASLTASANLTHLIVGGAAAVDKVGKTTTTISPSLSFSPPPPPVLISAIALVRDDDGVDGRWCLKVSSSAQAAAAAGRNTDGMMNPPPPPPPPPTTTTTLTTTTTTTTTFYDNVSTVTSHASISFGGSSDDACHVIHTGGSTGAPKAVVCAHRGSLFSHAARAAALPYDADADVTVRMGSVVVAWSSRGRRVVVAWSSRGGRVVVAWSSRGGRVVVVAWSSRGPFHERYVSLESISHLRCYY